MRRFHVVAPSRLRYSTLYSMKRALITGVTGQDGSYLAEYLVEKGYEVWGMMRRTSLDPLLRIHRLADNRTLKLVYASMRDEAAVARVFEEVKPDEVYNLAALSDVSIAFKCPEETYDINHEGVGRVIRQAIRVNPKVRIYQASTSEMFGKTEPPQDESSLFNPVSPYAIAKLKAYEEYVKPYRERGTFIASGFAFNHESPRRGEHFVTRKITVSLAKVKLGLQESFSLGNLEARRDWGFAGDYVEAMHLMMQKDSPGDYVLATGVSHSIRDFVEAACAHLGTPISWQGTGLDEKGVTADGRVLVRINKEFYRPIEVDFTCGNNEKARKELGWQPKVTFEELVGMMLDADIKREGQLAGLSMR